MQRPQTHTGPCCNLNSPAVKGRAAIRSVKAANEHRHLRSRPLPHQMILRPRPRFGTMPMTDVTLRYCIGCNAMNGTEEVNNTKGDHGWYVRRCAVRSRSSQRVIRVSCCWLFVRPEFRPECPKSEPPSGLGTVQVPFC